ncbi:MAG: DUF4097 family beta strand repeat-containing protein [Gemmatimonadota bacterium]
MTATLLVGMLAAAFAQQQTDTTFAVRPNSRVEVETFGGQINIKGWNRNEIHLVAIHGRRDVINIDVRGTSVQIEAEGRVGPAIDVSLNLMVPAAVSLDLSGVHTAIAVEGVAGDIDAETVQGYISVSGGARLDLESVEGEIAVEKARGRVSASTVNRGIRIADVIGDIEAETVNGPISVRNVQASSVDLATVNGRIVYDGTISKGGDYSIASHNGGVWVVVPTNAGVNVSISTFNGELNSTLPITIRGEKGRNRDINFVFGDGSARLDIESFGGDVHLRRPGEAIPPEPPATPRPAPRPRPKINWETETMTPSRFILAALAVTFVATPVLAQESWNWNRPGARSSSPR